MNRVCFPVFQRRLLFFVLFLLMLVCRLAIKEMCLKIALWSKETLLPIRAPSWLWQTKVKNWVRAK